MRLGLAVWRAKPAAFRQFDDWMFGSDRPVAVDQARAYAAQLVGADKLQAALADAWVPQQLLTDCRLHYTNWIVGRQPGYAPGDSRRCHQLRPVEFGRAPDDPA